MGIVTLKRLISFNGLIHFVIGSWLALPAMTFASSFECSSASVGTRKIKYNNDDVLLLVEKSHCARDIDDSCKLAFDTAELKAKAGYSKIVHSQSLTGIKVIMRCKFDTYVMVGIIGGNENSKRSSDLRSRLKESMDKTITPRIEQQRRIQK
jgi:hypothetical protein